MKEISMVSEPIQHMACGAEALIDGYQLSVIIGMDGAAQAQLHDKDGKLLGVTPTVKWSQDDEPSEI